MLLSELNVGNCVKTRLSDLQLELGQQTNVKRHRQMLQFNGRDVKNVMMANDVVSMHLRTSENQPLALLPTVVDGGEYQPARIQRIMRKSFDGSTRPAMHRLVFLLSLLPLLLLVQLPAGAHSLTISTIHRPVFMGPESASV